MSAATLSHDAFAPQRPPGMRSGLVLAILAHLLLVAALAWSVSWKTSEPEGVVAELWSATPQIAAPRPTPVVPPPPVVVTPPRPAPTPKPEAVVQPRVDPQIAIEQAREKARREEADRIEAARKADLARREQAQREQADRDRQRLADEQAEKKKLAEQTRQQEAQQAAIRQANLRRMMSQAGTSDDPTSTGTAARTSGPSASWAGRVKAIIKPKIALVGEVSGNPLATVEVRLAPDGTIIARKLVKSSGSPVWDETVLRAIDKTGVLPRDTDGRVPPVFTIDFRPQE
jgi:colicin import membrane protein